MKIETKTKVISDMVGLMSSIVTDCRLKVTTECIEMRAIDAAGVAMISVVAKPELFTIYDVKEEEVGLDIQKLNIVLSILDDASMVTISTDDTKKKLVIETKNKKFGVRYANISAVRPWREFPNIKFDASTSVGGSEIVAAVRAAQKFEGESIRFNISEGVFFASYEDDSTDMKLDLVRTKLDDFAGGSASSIYNTQYLSSILKFLEKSIVKIETGTNVPLKLYFTIDKSCSVVYFLAPRIEPE